MRQDLGIGHDRAALGVDGFALRVHDVIIKEQLAAHVVVHHLDLFLGIFNGTREQRMLDRLALFHAQLVEHPADTVGAEQAQQVVFKRQIESRTAGVALTA